MPAGILGTRADLLIDISLLIFILLPLVLLRVIRLVRTRQFNLHRQLQTASLVVMTLAVVLLETDIRLHGGSRALMATVQGVPAAWARALLLFHIGIAVATWLSWMYLVVRSWRTFRQTLPGTFSVNHRRLGMAIWFGVVIVALTGTMLYVVAYVL